MDIELHYIEKGAGRPLILLHGNGESHRYFEFQIDLFSSLYRVIAIDTRGHGDSPRGDSPFTISQFADDLYEFMIGHDIPKANILGFSDGGNIALTFALKHQDMVEKLILNGANLNPMGVKRIVQVPIEIGFSLASFFAKRSCSARKKAEMLGLMVHDPNIDSQKLNDLTVPTLVIAGTKDLIQERHTKLIYESLPNAQLSIVTGDHFAAHKHPDEFNRIVMEFLKDG